MNSWYQVSRRYRTIARLPEGKTGIQALIDAADASTDASDYMDEEMKAWWRTEHVRWANMLGEHCAGDHFLRVFADGDLVKTLSRDEWKEFLAQGGTTYRG